MKHDTNSQEKLKQQKSIIQKYKKQDTVMKWAIIIAIAFILFLLLLLGLATDWTRGLRKDNSVGTSTSDGLDSLQDSTGTATDASRIGTGSSNTSNTSKESGTNNQAGGTSTAAEKTNTTTNNTTTTNNNTTKTDPTPPSDTDVVELYSGSILGDNIKDLIAQANELGVPVDCHTEIVVKICEFDQDGQTVTVRSLLGTGVITGITKNF